MTQNSGPLSGIRVLEFTTVVLGPWACQALGDLGADVIKVEPPEGDSSRQAGPARHAGMASLFLGCNRNKRSVVLDLKTDRGRAAALRLAACADVLIHNFRPQALARLGIGYDVVRAVNPRIVYCATYGYSRKGPYAERPAYDDSIQAAAGVAGLAARVDGEPRYAATILGDKTTSLAVVSSVLAALFHRERSGEGQEIEVPMFETVVHYVMAEHLAGAAFAPPLEPPGYARTLARRPFATLDGWISVLPYMDAHWRAFCEAAERPDLATDPRFAKLSERIAHSRDYYDAIAGALRTRPSAWWIDALTRRSVPVTAVVTLEDLIADEHLRATGFWRVAEHPTEGALLLPESPATFSATPASIRRLPPLLGEHSREVLLEAGLEEAEIAALADAGITRV